MQSWMFHNNKCTYKMDKPSNMLLFNKCVKRVYELSHFCSIWGDYFPITALHSSPIQHNVTIIITTY